MRVFWGWESWVRAGFTRPAAQLSEGALGAQFGTRLHAHSHTPSFQQQLEVEALLSPLHR